MPWEESISRLRPQTRSRKGKDEMITKKAKLFVCFTPVVFADPDRWGCIPAPLRWHILRSLPWVRAWGQSCCQVSAETQETGQSLHLYSRLCSDAPLSVFLQICHYTKLQLCGEWFPPSDSKSWICPFGWGSFCNYFIIIDINNPFIISEHMKNLRCINHILVIFWMRVCCLNWI